MKFLPRAMSTLVFTACVASTSAAILAQIPAFPGAYGFGASATGGRGGTIYHVTNLNDSGPGSFRDAVSQQNRIIVFDVGGYIVLQSPVSVSSNLTIEGQTAPGGGIGIMAGEVSLSNSTNIILRGVRIRQGNQDPQTGKSALGMSKSTNMVIDHCSFEYGQWDSIDAVGAVNFTVQNSIIANPIYQQFAAHVETGPSTFYRNLWVNAHNRQPLAKDNTQYVNNIIYNYELGYTSGNTGGYFSHDIVNNYFITGPMTSTPSDQFFQMNNKQTVYAVGNMLDSTADGILNGVENDVVDQAVMVSTPWSPVTASIPTVSTTAAYGLVTANAGAFPRDEVDTFVLGDVQSLGLKGQLYKDQAATGIENDGYGIINGGTPFADANDDGIPDYWATANGISTTDSAAGSALYGNSGYTNLEAYANSLILPAPWSAADIVGTPLPGATSYNTLNNQWLLTGSGQATLGSLDEGQFASQLWNTDGTFTAKLLTLSAAGPSASAGIMARASNNNSSAFVAIVGNGSGGVSFLWRNTDGQTANGRQANSVAAPVWVRIVRKTGSYAGYYSTDGSHWTLLGIADASLPSTVQSGLVLASGSETALGTASFSNIAITADTGSNVSLAAASNSFAYPASSNVVATVAPASAYIPTGAVQIWDNGTPLTTQSLQGDGKAYWYIQPSLSAGTHLLTATYAGDTNTPAGFSSAVTVTVNPAPITLSASCWNPTFAYGANYSCTANVSSNAGAAPGTLHYVSDGAPFDVPLNNGSVQFSIQKPDAGSHSVTLSYLAQGNFAGSQPVDESYTVTAAPTQVALTPSSYYQSAVNPLVLQVAISTWSAPPPSSGVVTFYDGSTVIGTATITSTGTASLSVTSLSAGSHTLSAVFTGSTDYAAASSQTVTVQLY